MYCNLLLLLLLLLLLFILFWKRPVGDTKNTAWTCEFAFILYQLDNSISENLERALLDPARVAPLCRCHSSIEMTTDREIKFCGCLSINCISQRLVNDAIMNHFLHFCSKPCFKTFKETSGIDIYKHNPFHKIGLNRTGIHTVLEWNQNTTIP